MDLLAVAVAFAFYGLAEQIGATLDAIHSLAAETAECSCRSRSSSYSC